MREYVKGLIKRLPRIICAAIGSALMFYYFPFWGVVGIVLSISAAMMLLNE